MAAISGADSQALHLDIPEEVGMQVFAVSENDDSTQDEVLEEPIFQEEDAESAIGVSMSSAHTRLLSPRTPAAEKAELLDQFQGGGLFDGPTDSQDDVEDAVAHSQWQLESQEPSLVGQSSPQRSRSDESLQRLPSPWTAGPRVFEKFKVMERDKSGLKGPSSGPTSMLSDLNVKRFVSSFNLPSLPKAPNLKDLGLPTISAVFGLKEDAQIHHGIGRASRANTLMSKTSPWDNMGSSASSAERNRAGTLGHPASLSDRRSPRNDAASCSESSSVREHRTQSPRTSREAPESSTRSSITHSTDGRPLRRSTSDQSLLLRRVASTGSSLGDDSRWENVGQMVNSRMQAFKDSWQDSNIRLPSMPALPNINLPSLKPEFFRPRGRSDPRTMTRSNAEVESHGSQPYQSDGTSLGRHELAPKVVQENEPRSSPKSTCPSLDKALEDLTGDLVIMGGYRGSVLRSAKPPHQQLWVPIKVGLNMRKVDLELGLTAEDEENAHKKIIASGMLSHIGPIDMGKRLLKKLRSCRNVQQGKLRIHDYGYDWRLSPHLLSGRLVEFLEGLPCNRKGVSRAERGATIIAHSMGGLFTRHAVNQRPSLVAGVVYAGVPQHCINILGPLRNGDDVLLSSKVLTAQVNFTLRTSFLLLPEDGQCFTNRTTKEDYPMDFFHAETWNAYRLSPCIAPTLPPFTAPEEKKSILSAVYNTLPTFPTPLKRAPQPSTSEPATGCLSSQVNSNPSVQCTIPRPLALAYLMRTLKAVKSFKQELAHRLELKVDNSYPPISVLYSTSVPTVYRARVACKEAISHADAYDNLQFASGDGVCLARAAMVPQGYEICRGGKIRVDRGHVGLLGDLEGVGKCLVAICRARQEGVGLGN